MHSHIVFICHLPYMITGEETNKVKVNFLSFRFRKQYFRYVKPLSKKVIIIRGIPII